MEIQQDLPSARPRFGKIRLGTKWCFQFINEDFFRWARPHKGLWRDVLFVRRSPKPAENAARRKKGHLWMETI